MVLLKTGADPKLINGNGMASLLELQKALEEM